MLRMLAKLRDERRFGLYCVLVGIAAGVVSLSTGHVVWFMIEEFADQPELVPYRTFEAQGLVLYLYALVLAPLIETVIYRWILALLTRYARLWLALIGASVLAGGAHGPYIETFVAVTPAFLLYAIAWHHWREVSSRQSYWAPAIAHAIANALILAVVYGYRLAH